MDPKINNTLDHLFRHEYGRIISGLSLKFGVQHIELIEDSVQDSIIKASQVWAFNGIPEKPSPWLFKVSKNKFLDLLKRQAKSESLGFDILEADQDLDFTLDTELKDEQLKMIFACCNSAIPIKDSLLLSLKLISGFNITEISRALLLKEENTKKSLQRAKNKFRELVGELYIPSGSELKIYLHRVVKVIYLMFNEGYKVSAGKDLINRDLCGEALRLALLLIDKKECKDVSSTSLISLISYKIARFDARLKKGKLVTLKHQNRLLWNEDYLKWANYYFHQATLFKQYDKLYLEASIEFQYHISSSFNHTDWKKILDIHRIILANYYSPKAKLNFLIVLGELEKANIVLPQLEELEEFLNQNHHFFAFKSELELKLGKRQQALISIERAIELSANDVEKKYLLEKRSLIL